MILRFGKPVHSLEHFFIDPIVRVNETYVLATRFVNTKVSSIPQATVLLLICKNQVRILFDIPVDDLLRIIRRPIIDNDDLIGI